MLAASPAGVPASRTQTMAALLYGGRTVPSYPCVFFFSNLNQQIQLRTLPTPLGLRGCLSSAASAAGCYAAVTPPFPLTNLRRVMDISQRLEFYQLRRADLTPPLKN